MFLVPVGLQSHIYLPLGCDATKSLIIFFFSSNFYRVFTAQNWKINKKLSTLLFVFVKVYYLGYVYKNWVEKTILQMLSIILDLSTKFLLLKIILLNEKK